MFFLPPLYRKTIDFPSTPELESIYVLHESPNIVRINIQDSTPLDASSVPATGDFTISAGSISSVSISGQNVLLTLAADLTYSSSITLSYTPGTNKIKNILDGELASFTTEPVINLIVQPYFLQHDTNMITERGTNWEDGYTATQVFPVHQNKFGTTYYQYFGAENDLIDSRDRVFLMTKEDDDGLPPGDGWSFLDADVDGLADIVLDRNPNPVEQSDSGQVYVGTVLDMGDGTYEMFYSGNRITPSTRYSVHRATATDPKGPYTRQGQIISDGITKNLYFPRVIHKDDPNNPTGLYVMLISNVATASEGRLFGVDYYTSSDRLSWTLQQSDVLNGTGIDGRGIMPDLWFEDGKWKALMSVEEIGPFYAGGASNYTSPYLGKSLRIYSSTNFTEWTGEGKIYENGLWAGNAINSWCGPFFHDGDRCFWIIDYKWKGQTSASSTEMFTNGKVLSTYEPSGTLIETPRGAEVFPDYVHRYYRADQPQEASITPIEVITQTVGTVVGSPTRDGLATILAGASAYVKFDETGALPDANYFGVKAHYKRSTSTSVDFPICGIPGVFEIRQVNTHFRVKVYGAAGAYKEYRSQSAMGDLNNDIDVLSFIHIGFLFKNGTLTLLCDYNTNVPTTAIHNDSFTALQSPTDDVRIGAGVGDPSTDYSLQPVQGFVTFSGVGNVTEDNWLNIDII